MKKIITLTLILFTGLASMTSCESSNKAEDIADKFFKHLQNEKYDAAINLLDTVALRGIDYRSQVEYMGNNQVNGKLMKAEKLFGFNTNVNNGVTTVKLPYALEYEKATVNFNVIVVDRGEGLKIEAIE